MTDNRTTELLPCPFCGSKVTPIETRAGYGELYCGNCDVVMAGNEPKTPEQLIEAWNTRRERTCELEINTDMSAIRCSKCGCEVPKKVNLTNIKFCSNCGAKVVSE